MTTDNTTTEVATETAVSLDGARSAFMELDPRVRTDLMKGIANALDLDGGSDLESLVESLNSLGLSPEVRKALAAALETVADAYESSKTSAELTATRMPALQKEWARVLATAAEHASHQNAVREQQVRNVLAIINNASEGRAPEQQALQLEVYNTNVHELIKNPDAWDRFVKMLRTRQLNSLQADIGYNVCVLSYDIGDPEATSRAAIENVANFMKDLANLGAELNIVFFLDVKAAQSEEWAANPAAAARRHEDFHQALSDTMKNLSWDPKDNGRLGQKLASLFGGNDVSRYLVLNGGVGLLAARKMDTDLAPSDAQHAILLSPSAVTAGLVAWSVAGNGPPLIPTGRSAGTGAVVGVAAAAGVALNEHQLQSRRAGLNLTYIPERLAAPSMDTSVTLAAADPIFNEKKGQCSVEAIFLSQYINRMAAQLVRRLPNNENDVNGRRKHIIVPLKAELQQLVEAKVLKSFDVNDNDKLDELSVNGLMDISIEFVEQGKLDTAKITVKRTAGGEEKVEKK